MPYRIGLQNVSVSRNKTYAQIPCDQFRIPGLGLGLDSGFFFSCFFGVEEISEAGSSSLPLQSVN